MLPESDRIAESPCGVAGNGRRYGLYIVGAPVRVRIRRPHLPWKPGVIQRDRHAPALAAWRDGRRQFVGGIQRNAGHLSAMGFDRLVLTRHLMEPLSEE
jgi:hypothetical protein